MSLTTTKVENLNLEQIESILKSGKYISILKKKELLERKEKLKKTNFKNDLEDFPEITTKTKKMISSNPWNNVSKKIYLKPVTESEPEPEIDLNFKKGPSICHTKQNFTEDDSYYQDYSDEDELHCDDY